MTIQYGLPRSTLLMLSSLVLGGVTVVVDTAQAQVIPDNTLGTESSVVVPLDATTQRIDGGAIRGSGLFHSFLEFGIPEGAGVYFSDPANVSTIFSRVTGSDPSNIFGTLGVLGNANLFLLNPNGILFGPHAQLDMSGSFVGSTADHLALPGNAEFSATNPTAPPLLNIQVSAPIGLVFEGQDTGVIVNGGNLAVGSGQNLALAGSTVISTGDLTAPQGEVAVVTALGEENGNPGQVSLTQAGGLIDVFSAPIPSTLSPEQLVSPQWLALPGLTSDAEGQLTLEGDNLPVIPGSVAMQQVMAGSATLFAANDLILMNSQLATLGNLDLLAQNTVQVRDSTSQPFIAAAGGDLLVQGNERVDIVALSHPRSRLFSGNNLVLGSNNSIIGDTHFYAQGNLRVRQLDGLSQTLLSPTDPVILTRGNVEIGDYMGASLHIVAGGSVTLGEVTIDRSGPVASTINPGNTNLFNSSFRYADLATFEVSDFEVSVNEDGTVTRVPVQTTIEIDGSTTATLDIRAGVDWAQLGGLPIDPIIIGDVEGTFSNSPEAGDITLGNVVTSQPDGQIFLTNQFTPNTNLTSGVIETQGINANNPAGGGNIQIYSQGNITTNGELNSGASSNTTATGNGGIITLSSAIGDITVNGRLESESSANSFADITADNGGDISLLTTSGDIVINGNISSLSFSGVSASNGGAITLSSTSGDILSNGFLISSSTSPLGTAGNAGDVTVFSESGDIVTNSINARSFSNDSTDANGGNITLASNTGSITIDRNQESSAELNSFSGSLQGNTGKGGSIVLSTRGGNIAGIPAVNLNSFAFAPEGIAGIGGNVILKARNSISNLEVLTLSTSSDSGGLEIQGSDNLSINNSRILTNKQLEFTIPLFGDVAVNIGGEQGQSGDVVIASPGNITFENTTIESDTKGPDSAGNIIISSPGQVAFNNSGILGNTSNSGQAGTLQIDASEVVLAGTVTLDGETGETRLLAQTSDSGSAGNILLQPFADGQTLTLNLQTGTQISAATQSSGEGGSITIAAPQAITISGAGEISVATFGEGASGDISVETGAFTLQNNAQLIASGSGPGIAGNLAISSETARILNGAGISVSNPQGQAGNISIVSQLLQLNNSRITAEIGKSSDNLEGVANIMLRLSGNLILENESLISAEAFNDANGGNIDIEAQFLIALPVEAAENSSLQNGSDIIAIANLGNGGLIFIDAQGIFGIEERRAIPGNRTNDIDASSDFGAPGQVNLNTLDDPLQSLATLPEEPVDTQLAETCQATREYTSVSFFNIGRGGTPPTPEDLFGTSFVTENWTPLDSGLSYEFDALSMEIALQVYNSTDWIYPNYDNGDGVKLILSCHRR